jgi:hypothetical protein
MVLPSMWKTYNIVFGENNKQKVSFKHFRCQDKVVKTNDVSTLKNGVYTYLIESKPNGIVMVVAVVDNPLEMNSKHFCLESNNKNSKVVVGGEMKVLNKSVEFNILSGTYTLKILKNSNVSADSLKNLVREFLSSNSTKKDIKIKAVDYEIISKQVVKISNIPKKLNRTQITIPSVLQAMIRKSAPRGQKAKKVEIEKAKLINKIMKAQNNLQTSKLAQLEKTFR